jgi:hypothetical protein
VEGTSVPIASSPFYPRLFLNKNTINIYKQSSNKYLISTDNFSVIQEFQIPRFEFFKNKTEINVCGMMFQNAYYSEVSFNDRFYCT